MPFSAFNRNGHKDIFMRLIDTPMQLFWQEESGTAPNPAAFLGASAQTLAAAKGACEPAKDDQDGDNGP
jgi:hypothetical protein